MTPVFVINLRRSPGRWAEIHNEASSAGIDDLITRYEGVERATSDITYWPYVNQKMVRRLKGRNLSEDQIGCLASQFSLWKTISANKTEAIVLEDDIGLTDNCSLFLEDSWQFSEKWHA